MESLIATTKTSEFKALQNWFAKCRFAIVAFSGGVDSSLVSFLANHFLGREGNLSVISDSPSLKRQDLEQAIEFCKRYRIPLKVVSTRELEDPRYASNPTNRCFYCKHTLYNELAQLASNYPGSWILNGTNADDLSDYRPGLEAAVNFCVRSPLADCGIDKATIRRMAARLGLDCWDKPASPCLSSRVAYGLPVTADKLRQIEAAEALLTSVGYPVARVRHYGAEGRIEVPTEDVSRLKRDFADLESKILALGFERVTVDDEGFVSGKLNRAITAGSTDLPVLYQ